MLGLLGLLGLCTRCASLEPMALTSAPCEQSAKPQPSTASCMLVRHGGVMLTKQIRPGWADSCEDCSRLFSQVERQCLLHSVIIVVVVVAAAAVVVVELSRKAAHLILTSDIDSNVNRKLPKAVAELMGDREVLSPQKFD